MISISHYLYRKSGKWATTVLLAVMLAVNSRSPRRLRDRTEHKPADQDQQAQKQDKKNKRGPRAIAVVEFLPGGGTRLVPIALWINDRFYDASLYGANPEPMALEPETLYQALTYGEPAGWFTVTTPRDVNGNWVAEGQWKPVQPLEARTCRAGREATQAEAQGTRRAQRRSGSARAAPPWIERRVFSRRIGKRPEFHLGRKFDFFRQREFNCEQQCSAEVGR